jgi:hypothetical protein
MPTGVTVSRQGRIFVNFPRWGDEVPFTVAQIRDGETAVYPDKKINLPDPNDPSAALVSVQSVVVDPAYGFWTQAARYSSREPVRIWINSYREWTIGYSESSCNRLRLTSSNDETVWDALEMLY